MLPRILLQADGSSVHERRLRWLAALFVVVALVQAGVFIAMPRGGPLVVYEDAPSLRLLEVRR